MATNIELIFRDFVMNKIKEIEDEGQHSGVINAVLPNRGVPHSLEAQGPGEQVTDGMEIQGDTHIDPAPSEAMECPKNSQPEPVRVCENTGSTVKGPASKEESETTRKRNKKHKRHKSKKKKKKRKEEKGSSSESGLESDGETRTQPSVKTYEVGASMEGRDAGAVEKASRTLPIGEQGEGRIKKEKRRASKKKKKKKSRKRDEEKMDRKSPTHSPSGSNSVSGTESEMECRPKSRLLPTTSPVVTSDKVKERSSPVVTSDKVKDRSSSVACPDAHGVIASPLADVVTVNYKPMCGEDSADRKDLLTKEGVAAAQLPDIIPKLESTHREDTAKEDLDISTEINRQQDRHGEEKSGRSSRSRSKSRSLSESKSAASRKVQVKKSRSHSCSPKRLSDKTGSRKAQSTSKRRSRSASKKKNSPKRRRSRSHSGRRKSRSQSVSRSRHKSRSLSAKRRRRSRSKSKSLSRRIRSRSRSWRSSSRRRNLRSLSQSGRRTKWSRSRSQSRRRRSRSRSVRRTRRTRSRSVVVLRRSRSRINRRSTSARWHRSRTRSPKRRQSKSQSPRQSRRSKSRSQKRNRSKSRSLQRRKHSKSRSPGRRHRSKSKSPKRGRNKSKTPKRKHSKSSSPPRKESKSRSVSKDGQSSERSSSPAKVEICSKPGSHSKSQLDADLTSSETEKRVVPERTDEVEVTSKEICSQLNMEGHSLKAETPFDSSSHEMGESSALCVEHSTDHSEKDVTPMGSWKPVPPLVDSKTKPESSLAQEVVSSATIKEQSDVTTNPHENKSPANGEDEKSFSAKMPLVNSEVSEPIVSYTAPHNAQPNLSSEFVSEDGNKDTESKSRSVSPQSDRLCEPFPSTDRSEIVEPDGIAFTEKKTEVDMVTPPDCGSSRSKSPVMDDGDCSRSYSPSTEEKPPATKNCNSPSQSKKHKSSKQRQLSKSRSPSRNKSSKSRSPSSQKRSRSNSSSQRKKSQTISTTRKKSKSPTKKIKSRSPSRSRKKRSKSKSPSRRRRSKSAGRKRKSRSRSRIRAKRSQSRSPKRKRSRSPTRKKRSKSRSPARRRRSKSAGKGKRSKSRSPTRRRRSQSRARGSQSSSHRRRSGFPLDRRDRWKRTPSHSPVLILRKRRSTSRPRRSSSKSPPRITELDKEQLLEIAKANAAAMCAKAGMPIPESLRPKAVLQLPLPSPLPNSLVLPLALNLPMNLPIGMSNMPNIAMNAAVATMNAALSTMSALTAMPALPTITNKPPPTVAPNTANIEEVKRKVVQKANSISIKELTEKCKKIAESKEEMAIAKPHVSDDEDDKKPFAGAGLKENKGITFSLSNSSAKPAAKMEAAYAKEFPVSSGSQHRKKEGEGAYGEWVPVDKKTEKATATTATTATAATAAASAAAEEEGKESDSVFPDAPLQPVDITLAVSERAVAQKRLAENPFDVNAICMLSRAQEQVDAWAQSNTIPGLFTGSTGAQVMSSEELSTSGPQAWIKKDQFLRATPVSGGVGEFLMRKMGWRAGEGLGKHREGTVEPILIDFKTDRKGLVAEGEKTQKSGSLVVMKDLLGKHPVSALMEMCNKKKWAPPEFVMVHDSGPDHRKNFLFKVVVNDSEYQPQTASPNKKHAKAMAATVALQAMGEVSGDNVYSGPVFTAATTTA